MSTHLPILQVIIPLLLAPLCLVMNSRRFARALMLISAVIMLLVTLLLIQGVIEAGVLRYALGGWAAPWGIEYRTAHPRRYRL